MGYLWRVFLKGLLTLLPILLTASLLMWIVTRAEWAFGDPLRMWLPENMQFPGMGLVVAVVVIFIVGFLVTNYLTQKFFEWVEDQLEKTPVIRSIYSPLRDVTHLFARSGDATQHRVVMVKLDPIGIEVLGLVTRDHFKDLPPGSVAEDSVAVFMPFSYGVGGITTIVKKSQIRETKLPADRAMQLAITGWIKA